MSAIAAIRTGRGGKREMICLSCPIGCHLAIDLKGDDQIEVTGNRCPKGEEYAKEEYFSPRRVVTATCRCASSSMHRVPVRTSRRLPVELIGDLLAELYALTLEAPMKAGDALLRDYKGTGVDVVLSTDLR